MIVYPDGKKNTSGQKLLDEHQLDSGIPQRLEIHALFQTPHTQARSGYTQLHPITVECYVGAQEECLDLLSMRNPTCGMVKPSRVTCQLQNTLKPALLCC